MLVVYAVAYLFGCWVGSGWQPPPETPALVGLALALLGSLRRCRWTPGLALCCLGIALASRAAAVVSRDTLQDGWRGTLRGTVLAPPRGHHCLLQTEAGSVWLHCPSDTLSWRDRVECRGVLVPLDGPRNPLEPDPRPRLWRQGCHHGFDAVAVQVQGSDATGLLGLCVAARRRALDGIHRLWPDPTSEALMRGFLIGDQSLVDPSIARLLEATGTGHLLVASGLKVAAVTLLVGCIFRLLPWPPWVRCVVSAAVLGLYAGVAAASWPVLRATLMACCALLAEASGDEYEGLNALAAAALVLALHDPLAPLDMGFQYSCVGMVGIFLFRDTVEACLAFLPSPLRGALGLTVCIQLAIAPLQVLESHQISWLSLLANAIGVPVVEAIVVLGCPLVLLASVGLTWGSAALVLRVGLAAVLGLLQWLVCLAVHPAWSVPGPSQTGTLQVTFLDVGQGDAAWIRLPCGQGILVDGGPESQDQAWNEGEHTVLPFLLRSGVATVPLVVVSHPHLDHYGGIPPVAATLPLETVVECGLAGQGSRWDAYRAAIGRPHVWQAGEVWHLPDDVLLRVLHPGRPISDKPNNASVVFRLEWRRVTFLFCGDAEREAEDEMLARCPALLRADVLKVPHHGSATSSTEAFLAAVRPRVAVVSVGRRNHLHLPNPTTMRRLSQDVETVLRTDRDGGVVVSTDGIALTVARTVGGGEGTAP